MSQQALYRFYGDTGQLLYVGITHDPGKRLAQHMATKHWWPSVRGISLEWYSSREDALAAERRAITVERPLMNVQRPAVAVPPARKCGHCLSCREQGVEHCDLYGEIDDDEDRMGGTCQHCGKEGCLYALGHEDGSQHGWTAAHDFLARKGGPR